MSSIKLYLKKSKIGGKLRTDPVSIIGKFSLGRGIRFEVVSGEKIEPKFWNPKQQKVKSSYRRHIEVNDALYEFKHELIDLWKKNELPVSEFITFCQSKFRYLPVIKQEKKTLFVAYDKFLDAYRAEKDKKTISKYTTLLTRLTDFEKGYHCDIATMDFNFYDAFKKFLYEIPNPRYPKTKLVRSADGVYDLCDGDDGIQIGIFDEAAYSYLIQLKTFLAWAEKRGYQVHQSYKSWKAPRRPHEVISLTSSELERLENHIFSSHALSVARDYLALESRIGIRISDIKRFDIKDLHNDKWTFTPIKGARLNQKRVTVHFKGYCAPALDILQKYNWKMPVISEQKLNENIKRACQQCGIDSPIEIFRFAGEKKVRISGKKYEFISSHIGRKTFITLASQAGLPDAYIMDLTGITELKTLRHYKGTFEDSAIEQQLEKVVVMRKAL